MSAKVIFSRGLKRITTPKLLGLLVGSLLLFVGLIAFDNAANVPPPPAPTSPPIPMQIPDWAKDKVPLQDWEKDCRDATRARLLETRNSKLETGPARPAAAGVVSLTPHVRTPPISTKPAATSLVMPVIGVVLLLTILATSAMLVWRLIKRIGAQKFTLFCGAVVFVLCGLFPPWLYTHDSTGTHSRSNAGCSFILSPPLKLGMYVTAGIQLDTSRLLIEWACVLAATGAGWLLTTGNGRLAFCPKLARNLSTTML